MAHQPGVSERRDAASPVDQVHHLLGCRRAAGNPGGPAFGQVQGEGFARRAHVAGSNERPREQRPADPLRVEASVPPQHVVRFHVHAERVQFRDHLADAAPPVGHLHVEELGDDGRLVVEEVAQHVDVHVRADRGDLDARHPLDPRLPARRRGAVEAGDRVVIRDRERREPRADRGLHQILRRRPPVGSRGVEVEIDHAWTRLRRGDRRRGR